MNLLRLTLCGVALLCACDAHTAPADAMMDASEDLSAGSVDLAGSAVDLAPQRDLALGGEIGAGTLVFGADCSGDGECQSGQCRSFQGGAVNKCTQSCTTATQAVDCPNPPSTGTCTNTGFCKF